MCSRFFSGVILCLCNTLAWTDKVPAAGLRAEQQGDWQQAISIYTNTLLHDHRNVAVWLKIAHIEYQLENYPLAINAYRHAIQIDSANPQIYDALSRLYAELNQPQNALQIIQKATALQPNNPDFLLRQAQYANWNKDAVSALASYQQLLVLKKNQNPADKNEDLLNQIAQLQNQLHHYQAAASTLQELAAQAPSAKIFQALSQSYALAQEPEPALQAIDQALQYEPYNIEFLNAKVVLVDWIKNKQTPSGAQPVVLSPFEQLIAEANNQAFAHHYDKAAAAMLKAIHLKPKDATLYKKLSEIYASANQAVPALKAVNQALKLKPNNIEYLRTRAHLAAWAGDKEQMQDSYLRILQLKPDDQDALLNIAFTYSWRGYTDKAITAYQYYLTRYPNDPRGWGQYAEPLIWIEAYKPALRALERYRQLHGSMPKYLRIKARALALAGFYQSAQAINDPLLLKKPKDPFLLSTQTNIYSKNMQVKKEVASLKMLHQSNPDYFELKGLDDVLLTPLKSNVNLGANYTWASDTNRVEQIPTVSGQYFLSPATSFLVQGFYEHAEAAPGSPFTAISGKSAIFDENIMLGIGTQIPQIANIRAFLGDLYIQSKNNHLIYDALLNSNLTQKAQITVESSYNLYRPYLVPQSARLISLQVMENRIGAFLTWQPIIQDNLNLVVSHSDLTDTNAYWHINTWPKTRIFSSEKWQVSFGINNDIWKYKKRLSDGYYSPLLFQGYEGTIDAYYALAHNLGCSLSAGFGMQKDETFSHYYYEEDLAGQLFMGIFTEWELRINGGYTLRMNPTGSYRSWISGIILTRRFKS